MPPSQKVPWSCLLGWKTICRVPAEGAFLEDLSVPGPAPQHRPRSQAAQVPSAAWPCPQVHMLLCFPWVRTRGLPMPTADRGGQ